MAIELVFNVLLGLCVLLYLAQAIQLPSTDNPADVLGAGGFPIIIGIIALIGLVMITVHTIKEKRKVDIPMLNLRSIDGRMVFINVLVLAAYVGLLDIVGFVLATLIYLIVAPLSMGYRKPAILAIFSILTTVVMVVVFGIVFYVPLPRGIEFFRDLSYMIY